MKDFIKRFKHAWILAYMFIYFIWFFALEAVVTTKYTSMHCVLDDYIPFNELFVIPYYLWFPFVAGVIAYFFFTSTKDYYKCCSFLFLGMTICLLIYTIWPNGQNLRPDLSTLGRDNVLITLIGKLYATDTNTNVCPSIHVYNTIGILIAIFHSETLRKRNWLKISSLILGILICFSTVFLKQHSVIDGICAVILAVIMYVIVYIPDYSRIYSRMKTQRVSVKSL